MGLSTGNTWPPLISEGSTDAKGRNHVIGGWIRASCVVDSEKGDAFFYPTQNKLTGFAADGYHYELGVKGIDRAGWFEEGVSEWRGERQAFPTKGLVLVSDAGVSILDLENNAYSLWMAFLRGDNYAFSDNILSGVFGCLPTEVTYEQGRVMLSLTPDPGATPGYRMFLVIDFVTDRVFVEYSQGDDPGLTGYEHNPCYFFVGQSVLANRPLVSGSDGSALTWWVEPTLPAGLTLDSTTGVISGALVEAPVSGDYTVTTKNNTGYSKTVLTLAGYDPSGLGLPISETYTVGAVWPKSGAVWSQNISSLDTHAGWSDSLSNNRWPVTQVRLSGSVGLARTVFNAGEITVVHKDTRSGEQALIMNDPILHDTSGNWVEGKTLSGMADTFNHGFSCETLSAVLNPEGVETLTAMVSDDNQTVSVASMVDISGYTLCTAGNQSAPNNRSSHTEGRNPSVVVFRPKEPAAIWVVKHNMHRKPVVQVFDSEGRRCLSHVEHLSDDMLEIRHKTPIVGRVVCFAPIDVAAV